MRRQVLAAHGDDQQDQGTQIQDQGCVPQKGEILVYQDQRSQERAQGASYIAEGSRSTSPGCAGPNYIGRAGNERFPKVVPIAIARMASQRSEGMAVAAVI